MPCRATRRLVYLTESDSLTISYVWPAPDASRRGPLSSTRRPLPLLPDGPARLEECSAPRSRCDLRPAHRKDKCGYAYLDSWAHSAPHPFLVISRQRETRAKIIAR